MSPTLTETIPGVVRLPNLAADAVTNARRAISAWLGAGLCDTELDHLTHAERLQHYSQVSYGDLALRESSAVQRVIETFVPAVHEIVGDDVIREDELHKVQIGLRFPGETGAPHIDGIFATNRADPKIPSAVVGVYLSDVGPRDGAFGVWPGLCDELRRYGVRQVRDPAADPDRTGYLAVLDGTRGVEPHLVTGPAGTAFLVHGGLVHCNATNTGTGIRVAVFMRFYRRAAYPTRIAESNGGACWSILADPRRAWVSDLSGSPVTTAGVAR